MKWLYVGLGLLFAAAGAYTWWLVLPLHLPQPAFFFVMFTVGVTLGGGLITALLSFMEPYEYTPRRAQRRQPRQWRHRL